MPYYRQVVLMQSSATPETISSFFKSCAELIQTNNGVFHGIEKRGLSPLGYIISDRRSGQLKKYNEARIYVNNFSISSTKGTLEELLKQSKECNDVIRSQTFASRDPFHDFLNHKNNVEKLLEAHQKNANSAIVPPSQVAGVRAYPISKKIPNALDLGTIETPKLSPPIRSMEELNNARQAQRRGADPYSRNYPPWKRPSNTPVPTPTAFDQREKDLKGNFSDFKAPRTRAASKSSGAAPVADKWEFLEKSKDDK